MIDCVVIHSSAWRSTGRRQVPSGSVSSSLGRCEQSRLRTRDRWRHVRSRGIPCRRTIILDLAHHFLFVKPSNVAILWSHYTDMATVGANVYGSPIHIGTHCCHIGTAIKCPVPDRVKPSFVIFDIRALWRSGLRRQSARMSQIANDGLTLSGTGCFIAVPIWQQWVSKG